MVTYGELKQDIKNYINRNDLDDQLDTFVRLAEKTIYKRLRAQQMERHSYAKVLQAVDYIFVPDATLEFMRDGVKINGKKYEYIPWANWQNQPNCWTRFYNKIYLNPPLKIGDQVDIYLWRDPSGRLVNDSDSFEELDDFYKAYLFGACAEAAVYIKDDAEASKFKGLMESEIAELNRYAKKYDSGHIDSKKQRLRL